LLNFARAESCYTRALEETKAHEPDPRYATLARIEALTGLGKVANRHRDFDGALAKYREALAINATPELLRWTADDLIRLGRTDEAIACYEWAIRLDPYHEASHYGLGNGYARKNYTQLRAAYPQAFADSSGRAALASTDRLLAEGQRDQARAGYERIAERHSGWVDAKVRLASLEFEDG